MKCIDTLIGPLQCMGQSGSPRVLWTNCIDIMPPKKKEEAPKRVYLGRPGNNLKMGIVGLPNVGKSTFFNAISKLSVAAENRPFCTIDPNVASVPLPDPRFNWLCEKYQPASRVPPTIGLTDIAGLVRGAAEGEGLGNAFLSHIGAVDGIFHMCRAFEDNEVTHVEGDVDPVRDITIINNELRVKDLEAAKKALEPLVKSVARGLKSAKPEHDTLTKVVTRLEEGHAVSGGTWDPVDVEILNRHQFLTAKPQIFLVNLSKRDYLRKGNKWLPKIAEAVAARGLDEPVVPFSCEFEGELIDMEVNEGADAVAAFKKANPAQKTMLPRILKTGYSGLQLQHFFTCGSDEVRGWTIRKGRLAPQAAGVIHTDFEKGFIMADVQAFADLKELGSEEAVKAAGKLRQQGKKYEVQDGDCIFFKFNT